MSKVLEKYIFSGFGFDVQLKNVVIKEVAGEEYPDINMNELKLMTAKALLKRPVRMTGVEIKFLRTFLKLSFDLLSAQIGVPASTLRSWENRPKDVTGLTIEQEKIFRMFVIHQTLESERSKMDRDILFAKVFAEPKIESSALDLAANG